MTKEKVIKKVYKILRNVTPLKSDCGKICGGECCKGDEDTGMILFPGEDELLKNNTDFTIKKDALDRNILICNGTCNRDYRPISCRIFPLFPLLFEGSIYIYDDPRAKGVCPLLHDEMMLNKSFIRKVGKAGKLLTNNEETSDFLQSLSDEICEILAMTHDFLGRKE